MITAYQEIIMNFISLLEADKGNSALLMEWNSFKITVFDETCFPMILKYESTRFVSEGF